jgi:cytochrome c oxidase assembly factor CtaG
MAAVAVAAGNGIYHGPPALTLARAFTSWTLDLPVLVLAVALAGCYVAGLRRVRASGQPWPAGRAVSFLGLGLGMLVIATMSWVGVYQNVLFWARSAQTILLLLVVPLFLALGRPLTLAIAARPRTGRRIEAVIRTRAARVCTFPLITVGVMVATPFALYFSGWYGSTFHNDVVRELTYLALMAPGFLFFWTLLRIDPVPRQYPYLVTLWITTAEVIFDAVLGLMVLADQNLIAGAYYHALARPWGPTPQVDQMFGGAVLWVFGDVVGLPFLAAQIVQMIRQDETEAAQIDAELDARDAGVTADSAAGTAPRAAVPDGAAADGAERPGNVPAGDRPWWETDPQLTRRYRPGT